MPLNQAQLMATPGGPGVTGAVKAGAGIAISGDGTISLNPNTTVAKLVAGANVTLNPATGTGNVTVNAVFQTDSDFVAGTVTLFVQASAPAGWSQVTTQNNKVLRVVSSSGGGSGGAAAFTTVFTSVPVTGSVSFSGLSVSGGTTSSVSQTPRGSVSLSGLSVGATSINTGQMPGHTHIFSQRPAGGDKRGNSGGINDQVDNQTGAAGSGGAHTHSASGSGTFNGQNMSHSHTFSASVSGNGAFNGNSINLNVQYVDAILCSKA